MTRLQFYAALLIGVAAAQLPQIAQAGPSQSSTTLAQSASDEISSPGNERYFAAFRKAVRADRFVTKSDARRGFKFQVPGKGTYELLDIKYSKGGQDCKMHLPSIVRALKAQPGGSTEGPQWINLSIYTINGKTHCFWPPNGACYSMVRFATP